MKIKLSKKYIKAYQEAIDAIEKNICWKYPTCENCPLNKVEANTCHFNSIVDISTQIDKTKK